MCLRPGSIFVSRDGKSEILDIIWNRWIYNGQTTLDGYYGMAGENWNASNFGMKRSWFFFDDEIVSLGSNVYANSSLANGEIKTYINSFKVKDISLQTDRGSRNIPSAQGVKQDLGSVRWIYHDHTGYTDYSDEVYESRWHWDDPPFDFSGSAAVHRHSILSDGVHSHTFDGNWRPYYVYFAEGTYQ